MPYCLRDECFNLAPCALHTDVQLSIGFHCLVEVFSFLDRDMSQWLDLRFVCQTWYKWGVDPLWVGLLRPVYPRLTDEIVPVFALLGLQSIVVDTDEGYFTDERFRLFSVLSSLRTLNLVHCSLITDYSVLRSFSHLQELTISFGEFGDDSLCYVEGLTNLQKLLLGGCKDITIRGISRLSGLTCLRELDLGGWEACHEGDVDLSPLTQFSQLEALSLSYRTSPYDFKPLSALSLLQKLDLGGCLITDEGLQNLFPLNQLQDLDVSECKLIAPDFTRLPQLRRLYLRDCADLKDESLNSVSVLNNLTSFWCSTLVSDITVVALSHCSALTSLDLFSCENVTDQAVIALSQLPNLDRLLLQGDSSISDAAVMSLSRLTKLTSLIIALTMVTDVGIQALTTLTNLKHIQFTGCPLVDVDACKSHFNDAAKRNVAK